MSAAPGTIPPPISWAQRNDFIFLSVDVECKDVDHKVTEASLHFTGTDALDATKKYDVTLTFLHPVDPSRVTSKNIGRCIEFTIFKKESGPYWPSLTGAKTKLHFLRANFSKWKMESDGEEEGGEINGMGSNAFDNLMDKFPHQNFDDFNVEDDDSDDNIPSLSANDEDTDDEEEEKKDVKSAKDK